MSRKATFFGRLAPLALAVLLGCTPRASAQDPSDSSQQQPDAQAPEPQDPRRVISRDTISPVHPNDQDPQNQDPNAAPRRPNSNRPRYSQPQAYSDAPDSITVAAGQVLSVRLNEPLSSDHNHVGDTFT